MRVLWVEVVLGAGAVLGVVGCFVHGVREAVVEEEEVEVVRATTAIQDHGFEPAVTGADLLEFQRLVRRVPVADPVLRYAVALVRATRPSRDGGGLEVVKKWVAYGASVRAAQVTS